MRSASAARSPGRGVNRRRILAAICVGAAAVPAGRVIMLRAQDNPLTPVSQPDITISGGWVLDAGDTPPGAADLSE